MIGTTLGSYRVTAKLGEGGMGVVYLAEHPLIGRKAAIKVLLAETSQNPDLITRFFNEARTTALIKHPGLVDIFDFGLHPSGFAYLVMEYLDGETLAARIAREGRLPPPLAVSICKQVTSAVGAAHGRGIVHRDLKPENIFLVPEKGAPYGLRTKILDFGIAKLGTSMASGNVRTTRTGSVLGTPLYMSPEQCKGAGKVDERTDIYSLGCILFEMLCGRTVFVADGVGELIGAHMFMAPPSIRAVDGTLPARLDNIILRMLAKDPAHRHQTMDEVDDDFAALVSGLGWEYSDRTARAIASTRPDRPKRSLATARMYAEPPPPPLPVRTTLGTSVGEIEGSTIADAPPPPKPRSSRLTVGLLGGAVVATVAAIVVVAATRTNGPSPTTSPHAAVAPPAAAAPSPTVPTAPPAPAPEKAPPPPPPVVVPVAAPTPAPIPAPVATPPTPPASQPAAPPPPEPMPAPVKPVPEVAKPAPAVAPHAPPAVPAETATAKPAEPKKPPGHPAPPRKPQRPAASGKDDDDLLNSR